MASCRGANLPMSGKALFDDPELVRIAPIPPANAVRGRKDFNLGFECKVAHKVGPIITIQGPSGGPRRRNTTLGSVLSFDTS